MRKDLRQFMTRYLSLISKEVLILLDSPKATMYVMCKNKQASCGLERMTTAIQNKSLQLKFQTKHM